jgi:hypothetical protein
MSRFHLLLLFTLLALVPDRCGGQGSQKFADWHRQGLKGNPAGVVANLRLGTTGFVITQEKL